MNYFEFCRELQNGVDLTDENNNPLDAKSKTAAFQGISAVVLSRIGMACPGMGKCSAKKKRLNNF